MNAERKPRTRKKTTEATEAAEDVERGKSKRVARSFYLDGELLERLRAAVYYLAAYKTEVGVRSMSDVIEPATWDAVLKLEKDHNGGKPFPAVGAMKTGRPLGS